MIGAIMLIILYFTPSIGAILCKKERAPAILALNIFAGWTFIGWVICVVWACAEKESVRTGTSHNE